MNLDRAVHEFIGSEINLFTATAVDPISTTSYNRLGETKDVTNSKSYMIH